MNNTNNTWCNSCNTNTNNYKINSHAKSFKKKPNKLDELQNTFNMVHNESAFLYNNSNNMQEQYQNNNINNNNNNDNNTTNANSNSNGNGNGNGNGNSNNTLSQLAPLLGNLGGGGADISKLLSATSGGKNMDIGKLLGALNSGNTNTKTQGINNNAGGLANILGGGGGAGGLASMLGGGGAGGLASMLGGSGAGGLASMLGGGSPNTKRRPANVNKTNKPSKISSIKNLNRT